jgi:hypothetical protein
MAAGTRQVVQDGHTMTELEDQLRSISETAALQAKRLQEIERLKGTLEPWDPRLVDLAEESEMLANQLAAMAVAERHLASEASES